MDYKKDLAAFVSPPFTDRCETGYFSVHGKVCDRIDVDVAGLGRIELPLCREQAASLISHMSQAPFGKGMETIVDVDVRRAWQLDAARVTLNSRWTDELLPEIVADVCKAMGMDAAQLGVEARLYKMLCYEKGGHFKKHRDTEKEPGMFGTLIVQLPSEHKGGVLTVEHKGEKREYAFEKPSQWGDETRYVAFFADCEHSLSEVTAGVRLVLAYNLVRTKDCDVAPSAASVMAKGDELVSAAVCAWEDDPKGPQKLAVLLEHKYTEQNVSFAGLKGNDRLLLDKLRGARDPASAAPLFDVHLSLMERFEMGPPVETDYAECRIDPADVDDDVDTSYTKIKCWVGSGGRIKFNLDIDFHSEILNARGEDVFSGYPDFPDKQEEKGYTGNEGYSYDRWYRACVLVFWPRTKRRVLLITCEDDFQGAIGTVEGEMRNAGGFVDSSVGTLISYAKNHREVNTDALLGRLVALCQGPGAAPLSQLCRLLQVILDSRFGLVGPQIIGALAAAVRAHGKSPPSGPAAAESSSFSASSLWHAAMALSPFDTLSALTRRLLHESRLHLVCDFAKELQADAVVSAPLAALFNAASTITAARITAAAPTTLGTPAIMCAVLDVLCHCHTVPACAEALTALVTRVKKEPGFAAGAAPFAVFPAVAELMLARSFPPWQPGAKAALVTLLGCAAASLLRKPPPAAAAVATYVHRFLDLVSSPRREQWPTLDAQLCDLDLAIVALPRSLSAEVLRAIFHNATVKEILRAPRAALLRPGVVDILSSLCRIRCETVMAEPPFTWCMPHASVPNRRDIEAFLRGPEEEDNFDFDVAREARDFCDECGHGDVVNGFSVEGERDGHYEVMLTKTTAYHESVKERCAEDRAERRLLQGLLDAASATPVAKASRPRSPSLDDGRGREE